MIAYMVKSEQINVKMTPAELEMVRRCAKAEGQTVSDYIRACVITVRGIEGDAVAWQVIRKNIQAMVGEMFPIRRKKIA